MSRRKKKTNTPSSQTDELGEVIEEETGISLSDLTAPTLERGEKDTPSEPELPSPTPSPQASSFQMPEHTDQDKDAELLGMAEEYEKESVMSRLVPAAMGIIVAILIVGTVVFGVIISRLLDAKSQADAATRAFESFEQSITNLDFRTALAEFPKGHTAIASLEQRVEEFQFITGVPWIGPAIRETYSALGILNRVFTSGEQLLSIVSKVGTSVLRTNGDKTFELYMKTLSIDEKGAILKIISEAIPTLNGARASLQLAVRQIDTLDQGRLSSQLRNAVTQTRVGAQEIQSAIDSWLPLAEVIPSFLGYPDEKAYLILLQDTSELRATGGFISHYGILKIHNGEVTLLKTDNVYNLDDRAERLVSLPPPGPVGQYLSKDIKKWFLRDANWSPDFGESARQSEGLYHLEGGQEKKIDGVLAATPELVRSLLRFSGPIRIEGRDYTADNVLENLAFEVREGNYRRGISEADRKEIFGQLIARMGERLLDLPLTRWLELYKIIEARLNEKNLLLSFHDQALQKFAQNRNWTGEIRQTAGDFLMVVDTTQGTLKTESVMDKQIRYTMRQDPDGFLVGHVELTYKNNGALSDVTTSYRDWVRILVPAGSTLVSTNGAQASDGHSPSSALEITSEHGTMQFGAFINVEPRYTKVFTLEYRLPDRIYDQMKKTGVYSLLVQKQPGNSHSRFQGNLMFLTPVAGYAPSGFFNSKRSSQSLDIFSDLRTDQEFTVQLEKPEEKKQ
ncbi:MAG: DUF4012 domain-containing protein [Candidatus Uhrbacteria bacterium]|nr:DUF4012 domain-containing protein [Candidatus Uhrbacteria bacterium]